MKIDNIVKLARIDLSIKEKKKFESQIESILNYVKKLNEVKTGDTEPIASINGQSNIFREDEIKPSLSQDKLLKNAPQKENGQLKVKAILERK